MNRVHLVITPRVPFVPLEPKFSLLMKEQIQDYINRKQSFDWYHPDSCITDEYGITWYENQFKKWRPSDYDYKPDSITYVRREECVESPLIYLKQGDPMVHPYPCFILN